MNYTSLTDAQREQVAFLFCDGFFDTDPHVYEYELTGETVTGRRQAEKAEGRTHAKKARQVGVMFSTRYIASDKALVTYRELARQIVARMVQIRQEA